MAKKNCSHIKLIKNFPEVKNPVCKQCVEMGDSWVYLRQCLICGNVGCCDSSKNKHATKHFKEANHPVMKNLSVEKDGGEWSWCYIDEVYLED